MDAYDSTTTPTLGGAPDQTLGAAPAAPLVADPVGELLIVNGEPDYIAARTDGKPVQLHITEEDPTP